MNPSPMILTRDANQSKLTSFVDSRVILSRPGEGRVPPDLRDGNIVEFSNVKNNDTLNRDDVIRQIYACDDNVQNSEIKMQAGAQRGDMLFTVKATVADLQKLLPKAQMHTANMYGTNHPNPARKHYVMAEINLRLRIDQLHALHEKAEIVLRKRRDYRESVVKLGAPEPTEDYLRAKYPFSTYEVLGGASEYAKSCELRYQGILLHRTDVPNTGPVPEPNRAGSPLSTIRAYKGCTVYSGGVRVMGNADVKNFFCYQLTETRPVFVQLLPFKCNWKKAFPEDVEYASILPRRFGDGSQTQADGMHYSSPRVQIPYEQIAKAAGSNDGEFVMYQLVPIAVNGPYDPFDGKIATYYGMDSDMPDDPARVIRVRTDTHVEYVGRCTKFTNYARHSDPVTELWASLSSGPSVPHRTRAEYFALLGTRDLRQLSKLGLTAADITPDAVNRWKLLFFATSRQAIERGRVDRLRVFCDPFSTAAKGVMAMNATSPILNI